LLLFPGLPESFGVGRLQSKRWPTLL